MAGHAVIVDRGVLILILCNPATEFVMAAETQVAAGVHKVHPVV